jgi:hypothetical protein
MASIMTKRPCCLCTKGVGILTCDGCQQSFCAKHIADHRQDLSSQMDSMTEDYNLLRQDLLDREQAPHPLLARINIWEDESIRKIQQNAQQARDVLQQCASQYFNQIKERCNDTTHEIQHSQLSGDYTEIDLQIWMRQLTEFRQQLDDSLTSINEEQILTSMRSIDIENNKDEFRTQLSTSTNDLSIPTMTTITFQPLLGRVLFSADYLVARHIDDEHRSTMIRVNQTYTNRTVRLRFRIEHKMNRSLFIGIGDCQERTNRTAFQSPALYGWMTPDQVVIGSRKCSSHRTGSHFDSGDEISLVLACDDAEIRLEHHRLNTTDRLAIDRAACSLPWQVVILLFTRNDCIRLMHEI